MRKTVFIIFALCFLCPKIDAQQFISMRAGYLSDKLPSSTVSRVFQDNNGFMWFGTLDGLCRYDGYRVITFRSDSDNPHLLTNNEISCFEEDHNNNLLIGTRKGFNILNKSTYKISSPDKPELNDQNIRYIKVTKNGDIWISIEDCIVRYDKDFNLIKSYENSLPRASINYFYEDNYNNLWALIWSHGLFKYNPETDNFESYPSIGDNNTPFRLFQDNQDRYWLGTWGDGFYLFDPEKDPSEMYLKYDIINSETGINENRIFSIVQDDKFGYIWLMSTSGIYAINHKGEEIDNIDLSYLFKDSNNIFSEIIKDKSGNLWIGSFSEGIYTINFEKSDITNYTIKEIKNQTGVATSITSICQNENNVIWVNQNRWGLGIYNTETDKIKFYNDYPKLKDNIAFNAVKCISCFKSDPERVWIAPENKSEIYVLNKNIDDLYITKIYDLDKFRQNAGNTRKLFEDRKNNIWVITINGLLIKPVLREKFLPVSFSLGSVIDITEDTRGNIWVCSKNRGLYEISSSYSDSLNFNIVKHDIIINDNEIMNIEAIHADNNGRLWIGTKENDFILYDIVSREYKRINSVINIINEGILNINSDHFGHIWISTNKRIVEYNHDNGAIKEYSVNDDDIAVNSFLVNSFFKNNNGEMLYGGNRGIAVFKTSENLTEKKDIINVKITDIKINNNSVFRNNENNRLNLSDMELTFEPDDKNIEIDFSSLNYINPLKMRYAYKMKGVDDEWIYTANNRQFAVYNQLQKGHYTFMVKAMDDSGLWSSNVTSLKIYKKPYFYETWWAYMIYIIIVAGIFYIVYNIAINRIRLLNDLRIAQIDKEKSEELTQTKLKYFTNISHDILTPLTIISCLIDDAEMTSKEKNVQFDSMRANISRLKRLMQQILDFRKIESGNLKLKISTGDIVMFTRNLCYSNFTPLIKKKNIEFSFNAFPLHIDAAFDADKIDKILFNLLSNALKYTPDNGKVSVDVNKYESAGSEFVSIKVQDSGIGISKENLDKIFIRFYSNKTNEAAESNGIGLNLTKELIELHHGSISVESKLNEGSLFTVDIPIDRSYYGSNDINDNEEVIIYKDTSVLNSESSLSEDICKQEIITKTNDNNPRILIVEDNDELLALMKNILSRNYNVSVSRNGMEALSIIEKEEADIILSDVMMPEMDGIELCKSLKANIATSHIPVILLTAKNSTEDRIECYNAGADGYISKPFELKVLEARISNFIHHKRSRQHEFQANKEINISSLEYTTQDEDFLMNSVKIIEAHLSDSDFDVNSFASEVYLSKSTLYRKIKTMTGLSPIEFIKNIRLKHACRLLKSQTITISEVAYMVGFSDPKYFSLCFKTEFNMTPSEYQKNESEVIVDAGK